MIYCLVGSQFKDVLHILVGRKKQIREVNSAQQSTEKEKKILQGVEQQKLIVERQYSVDIKNTPIRQISQISEVTLLYEEVITTV